MKIVDDFLDDEKIAYIENYNIRYNSFSKTGGLVKRFLLPHSVDELVKIVEFFNDIKQEFFIVGETTNSLFLDSVIYSVFISMRHIDSIQFNDNFVRVGAGRTLPDLVRIFAMHEIAGFEGLEGIPASIGGAIKMNAGAYGYSISDNLTKVIIIDDNSKCIELELKDLEMDRRKSIFSRNNNWIIIAAIFEIKKGNASEIESNIEKYHIARHTYQEWVYPNLGSIFSIPGNIYDKLKPEGKLYYLELKLTRSIFFNKVTRFFKRKKPSNSRLNAVAANHICLDSYKEMYSHKNLNTFINKNKTTNEILTFILYVKDRLSDGCFVENELITKSVEEVVNQSEFKLSMDKLVRIKDKKNGK